jgi:hypothetical protein
MSDKQNSNVVMIKKASGKTEAFEINKLRASLKNAGATEDAINEVVADIQDWVFDGVSTGKIYTRAFRIFRQISTSGALLYRLKKAILDMGPSGYPFEHFVGELFRLQGYDVEVGQVMEGASVTHEMDVIAKKGREQILGECKFSHKQGHSVSIQVPLYVHSRVNDIVEKLLENGKNQDISFCAWIFTNGRFSPDSIEYSRCKGIKLMGWDYPKDHALKDLIEREKMFPITILTNLSIKDKKELMAAGIVTCAQLREQSESLHKMGFSKKKQSSILKELDALAGTPGPQD